MAARYALQGLLSTLLALACQPASEGRSSPAPVVAGNAAPRPPAVTTVATHPTATAPAPVAAPASPFHAIVDSGVRVYELGAYVFGLQLWGTAIESRAEGLVATLKGNVLREVCAEPLPLRP